MRIDEQALAAATEALQNHPLSISSSRRSGNGLRNADEVARATVTAYLAAASQPAPRMNDITDLVYAIARRICELNGGDPDERDDYGRCLWESHIKEAREAIRMVREASQPAGGGDVVSRQIVRDPEGRLHENALIKAAYVLCRGDFNCGHFELENIRPPQQYYMEALRVIEAYLENLPDAPPLPFKGKLSLLSISNDPSDPRCLVLQEQRDGSTRPLFICQPETLDASELVEALEFYADKANYRMTEPKWDKSTAPPRIVYPLGYPDAKVLADEGKMARISLARWREKGGDA